MSETALKVENLSKLYRLGEVGTGTISDDLKRWWFRMRGKEDPFKMVGQTNTRSGKSQSDYVWALKDINFEVQQGEVLGIIGKNGAGKSTLLKILSRITGPTDGKIWMKGRVASLLEVGTGMHPDLTAKENIYLNGAILGMTKQEIKKKFDEIVDFAGISMFINTPVKRFSSGMRVRIGFAVAAFLEPEILIVDEVLAVGDAEFQKKAIGKMKDVSRGEGRTVLFVSHNMASIIDLCDRSVLLKDGCLESIGNTKEIVSRYLLKNNMYDHSKNLINKKRVKGNEDIVFEKYDIKDANNKSVTHVISGQDVGFYIHFNVKKQKRYNNLNFSVAITDEYNNNLIHLSTNEEIEEEISMQDNVQGGVVTCRIKNLPLPAGSYHLNFFVSDYRTVFDRIDQAGSLMVEDGNFFGTGKAKNKTTKFLHRSKWNFKYEYGAKLK